MAMTRKDFRRRTEDPTVKGRNRRRRRRRRRALFHTSKVLRKR
jgi:hypothetical protein